MKVIIEVFSSDRSTPSVKSTPIHLPIPYLKWLAVTPSVRKVNVGKEF